MWELLCSSLVVTPATHTSESLSVTVTGAALWSYRDTGQSRFVNCEVFLLHMMAQSREYQDSKEENLNKEEGQIHTNP